MVPLVSLPVFPDFVAGVSDTRSPLTDLIERFVGVSSGVVCDSSFVHSAMVFKNFVFLGSPDCLGGAIVEDLSEEVTWKHLYGAVDVLLIRTCCFAGSPDVGASATICFAKIVPGLDNKQV